MIYLRENPLLRKPLQTQDLKIRLLGHWGSDPGMSFMYVHLNRLIRKYDLNMIFIAGPGHGAPAVCRTPIWRERTRRFIRRAARTKKGCAIFSGSSRFPEASEAIALPKHLAPFMKAANSATACRMLLAVFWTTLA